MKDTSRSEPFIKKEWAALALGAVIYFGSLMEGLKSVHEVYERLHLRRLEFVSVLLVLTPLLLLRVRTHGTQKRNALIITAVGGLTLCSLAVGLMLGANHVRLPSFTINVLALVTWTIYTIVLFRSIPGLRSSVQIDSGGLSKYASYFPSAKDMQEVLALRARAFEPTDVVSPQTISAMHRKNPFSFRLVEDSRNRSVGYWNVLAVKRDTFFAFRRGELTETELASKALDIRACKGIKVYLYIGAVASTCERTSCSVATLLDLGKFLIDLNASLHIAGILAWASSDQGLAMANHFRFRRSPQELSGRPIYYVSNETDIHSVLSAFDRLLNRLQAYIPVLGSESQKEFSKVL